MSLTSESEVSLLEGTPPSISTALRDLHRAKQIELLMLELLECVTGAGLPMDRDSIDSFVEDIFADPVFRDQLRRGGAG